MRAVSESEDEGGRDRMERSLLAVDLGLKLGLACYGADGRLRWYRSQHFANKAALKRGIFGILRDAPGLEVLVLEGDRALGELFAKLARKRGAEIVRTDAHGWRRELMPPRDRRSGAQAKEAADELARRVIAWSGAARPTSLRHDAAEAILIGLWGARRAGWLEEWPDLDAPT